jgi:flagellar motor protein MotB
MFEPFSIILSGLGLMQNTGSSKVQKQMVGILEQIRDILKNQPTSKASLLSLVPEPLWLT